MVFLLKKEENGQAYYYLAHNMRSGKKWKSLRKYLGKKPPTKKELENLKQGFAKEFGILLEKGFQYLNKEKLEKIEESERVSLHTGFGVSGVDGVFTVIDFVQVSTLPFAFVAFMVKVVDSRG